jgi:hypothetical protein
MHDENLTTVLTSGGSKIYRELIPMEEKIRV